MVDSYVYLRLRGAGRDARDLMEGLREHTLPAWSSEGLRCWGIWEGLFGIGSNELLVMAGAPGDRPELDFRRALPAEAQVVDALPLVSTVRPKTIGRLPAEGVYVFRFFDVRVADCDAIVALSQEAWETFEDTDRYVARPEGLFRPRGDDATEGRMLLVTWYDGLRSWEISRNPAPEALDNFRRRRGLTAGTVAYATRLVT